MSTVDADIISSYSEEGSSELSSDEIIDESSLELFDNDVYGEELKENFREDEDSLLEKASTNERKDLKTDTTSVVLDNEKASAFVTASSNLSCNGNLEDKDFISEDSDEESFIVRPVRKQLVGLKVESDDDEDDNYNRTVRKEEALSIDDNVSTFSNYSSNSKQDTGAIRKSYRESIVLIDSRSPSPSSSLKSSILDVTSDEEHFVPPHQSTILISKSTESVPEIKVKCEETVNLDITGVVKKEVIKSEVSISEYMKQQSYLQELRLQEQNTQKIIKSVNMQSLPDKGRAIVQKLELFKDKINEATSKLNNMVVKQEPKIPSWKTVQAQIDDVQPKTFGKRALQTLNVQKALTMDRLEQLHGSVKNCPTSDTIVEDPKGLKIELMTHQKQAIAWLLWREKQKPSGGILADDMGLGKTLTMIALALKEAQLSNKSDSDSSEDECNENRRGHKYPGGTLVVCPASVLFQWEAEIKKHVKRGVLSVDCYHGPNRETNAKRLSKHDFIITTYALVMGDNGKHGPLYNIKWRRVVLDEAHQVRNYKSQTSIAVCSLSAKSRWALTGTPIHNKELDIYALLKYLRCSPFDDLIVWRRWVANKATGGQDRLNMVISSLILRRTKQQLVQKKMLNCLPEKNWKILEIKLNKNEMDVYQKVLIFSRTLFAQFLHQRAERDADTMPQLPNDPNGAYYKMHKRLLKLNKVKKIKQHEILVLLLRLRQICCHPSLITGMLQGDERLEECDEGEEEFNLLEQLGKLNLEDAEEQPANDRMSIGGAEVGLAEASRNFLNPSNPVFAEKWESSKVKTIMKILQEISIRGDKTIVVSQWTKFLGLVGLHLKKEQFKFYALDGSIPVNKRMEIVENFNNPSHKVNILLLSLTAGGVGLNLIGANHLILADLHWNPQLEMQAQDRIFRVGQTKPVTIYKLITDDTIEQRIKSLQDQKLSIAEQVLSGAKIQEQSKLSLDDLKMLFQM